MLLQMSFIKIVHACQAYAKNVIAWGWFVKRDGLNHRLQLPTCTWSTCTYFAFRNVITFHSNIIRLHNFCHEICLIFFKWHLDLSFTPTNMLLSEKKSLMKNFKTKESIPCVGCWTFISWWNKENVFSETLIFSIYVDFLNIWKISLEIAVDTKPSPYL